MNRVDLHMHTTYSDGKSSPRELLEAAKKLGLSSVAITDHETAQGNRDAQVIAHQLGLELIPGIEITVSWAGYTGHGGGPDIDILGYFIDLESPILRRYEQMALAAYTERARYVCRGLQQQGLGLTVEDVLATNATYPGYMAIVRSLLAKGLVSDQGQASRLVEQYWNERGMALQMAQAIQLVHDLGGVAVLAHPSIIRRDDLEPLNERGVADLVAMGLDGIEVYHYRNSEQQRRYFDLLARMFKLPITGGSDEHGGPRDFSRLGREPVTPQLIDALRDAHVERHAGRARGSSVSR